MIEVERKKFEKFLEAIVKVHSEAEIVLNKEEGCLESIVIEPGHVYMVKTILPCWVKENTAIGIDVEKTLKLLKTINDEMLNIKIDGKLWINDKIGIGLIDTSAMTKPKIPQIEFDIKTDDLNLQELRKIIGTGKIVSDIVRFTAKDGVLTVKIEGDIDVLNFEICRAEGEGTALYSIEILYELLKGLETGKLLFGTDKPLKIESSMDSVYTMYLLAPRIEGD